MMKKLTPTNKVFKLNLGLSEAVKSSPAFAPYSYITGTWKTSDEVIAEAAPGDLIEFKDSAVKQFGIYVGDGFAVRVIQPQVSWIV
jgi:hypothetical protein